VLALFRPLNFRFLHTCSGLQSILLVLLFCCLALDLKYLDYHARKMISRLFVNFSRSRSLPGRFVRYGSTEVAKSGESDQNNDVEEEEKVLSRFVSQELIPAAPIKCLDLTKNIQKVQKKGSFTVDIFTGRYDEEFLIYPDILADREQNKELKHQLEMVKQLYPKIWMDEYELQKHNFFNLHQLSVTEMMTIFEAIGSSARTCADMELASSGDQAFSVPAQTKVSKSIISLIIRNCLAYWPMSKSSNEYLKRLLPKRHILFGGSTEETKLYPPIGFCWTEQAEKLGSLPPQEWLTLGTRGDSETNAYLIKGKKTRVLYEDAMDHFLVYFRDAVLSKTYLSNPPEDEANPASDPFVGCALLEKSQVSLSDVYFDSSGCEYIDLEVDQVIPNSQIVFHAQRNDPHGVNIKALGQLATCSVVMGILKDTLRMTYTHLVKNKSGLLDCDIIQKKLTAITSKVFALESMVYYIAGMYDGLEEGFDAHMEATILKILTNDFAHDCLRDVQLIFGSDMFMVSKIQDQINKFDSFLDGNIFNRLYIATMGILWFARNQNLHLNKLRMAPWYPGYFVTSMLRERAERGDYLTLSSDIQGHVHPSLREAAINLEYIVKRIKYATETLCRRYGSDVVSAQSALYKLSEITIDSFLLTAVCARASKSHSNGSKHSELDVDLANAFSLEQAVKVRIYMEQLNVQPITGFHSAAEMIHAMNLKSGGYYAESPLDTNL